MKYFEFDPEKNASLKKERSVSFDEVIAAIQNGQLLDIIRHPNTEKYSHQDVYVININNYAYAVPFVKSKTGVFLKTIFPSRKLTKQYLNF